MNPAQLATSVAGQLLANDMEPLYFNYFNYFNCLNRNAHGAASFLPWLPLSALIPGRQSLIGAMLAIGFSRFG
jgi:hypothetical protein